MTAYVALLRAVNVGGTGKLPMADLAAMAVNAGFADVRTYIASGNLLFRSDGAEDEVREALETRVRTYAGRDVGVLVRTAAELADVCARNPFPEAPGNRVACLFVDEPLTHDPLEGVAGVEREEIRVGVRELFIFYPDGMGQSRLRIPVASRGTVRNMNTVAKLADMAAR